MINVQYPFLDLTRALLALLQNLKPTEGDKLTLYKSHKISMIANQLVQIHINKLTTSSDKVITLNMDDTDTTVDFDLNEYVKELELIVNNKTEFNSITAKEYCYCWLLQQYIRQALNNQSLLQKAFYFPFLNLVMQGLAVHYHNMEGTEGTVIKVEVVGEAGGVWMIEKVGTGWQSINMDKPDNTTIYLDQQVAWLLFSDSIYVNEIGQFCQIIGSKQLGNHFLSMRTSIVL